VGNGDTLQRSTGRGTPAFRLFYVAAGGTLALTGLTLSNGLANSQFNADGGAIYNQGTLSLDRVTVENCAAQGQSSHSSSGGGIYSGGALAIADSVIQNNRALGGSGQFSGAPGWRGTWRWCVHRGR
jgi:hypothetical protein